MNLSGATVRNEHVLSLATMVDGELGAKLNRAIANSNTIVALSAADRERLLEVLAKNTPGGLLELRNVLIKQGDNARRREVHSDRHRRDLERRRRNPRGAASLGAVDGGPEPGVKSR